MNTRILYSVMQSDANMFLHKCRLGQRLHGIHGKTAFYNKQKIENSKHFAFVILGQKCSLHPWMLTLSNLQAHKNRFNLIASHCRGT